MQRHSELNFKTRKIVNMPKAQWKSREEEEDDVPLHGAINETEAKEYSLALDYIVIKMGSDIKEEAQDAIKKAIVAYKK